MIKVADYVMRFVASLGVDKVFFLPGGGCMHLVDALGSNNNLTEVVCLHEQAVLVAADGYAQYRNDLGVALVTTGPGGTNAITGVAASYIDSVPLLVISGQVKRQDLLAGKGVRQMGIQEVDIVAMVEPVTKYAVTVMEPEDIRYHLEKALYLARQGRPGPVWLDIPLDVQGAMVDEESLRHFTPPATDVASGQSSSLSTKIDEIITLLNKARRPVIMAGMGIRLARAEEQFLSLLADLKLPVLTTWRSMDMLPEEHPLYFGRPGSIASRYANFIQQNADFILVLGCRLDLPQVGHSYDHFGPAASKVIVDIDPAELAKISAKDTISICADVNEFISAFREKRQAIEANDIADWLTQCERWRQKYPVILPEYLSSNGLVNTYALIDVLSEQLTGDDVIVPGSSGSCAEITRQAFALKAGQRMINSPGLGSMGFALPQGLGVALASGQRTIVITGDGDLQHNIQEMETIHRLKLPLKIFVLNNNGYAAIRNTHNRFFDGRLVGCDPSSGLTLPDTCKVAAAYGLETVKIAGQESLAPDVAQVLALPGPVVCEVMVDPDLQMAPKLSSFAHPDGSMESRPLEDLWPFLDRDEFAANMFV